MPWIYQQSTGQITDPAGHRLGCSYAGHGEGKNNPQLQDVRAGARWNADHRTWAPVPGLTADDFGPLPCGLYTMLPPVDTKDHGPFVMWLTPDAANQMFGRSGFGWHGDAIEHPGLASDGCICSPRAVRGSAWGSPVHQLQVIP